jgi:hypothetical protein
MCLSSVYAGFLHLSDESHLQSWTRSTLLLRYLETSQNDAQESLQV